MAAKKQWKIYLLWTCLSIGFVILIAALLGPKAASYTGGGIAVAAILKYRESRNK